MCLTSKHWDKRPKEKQVIVARINPCGKVTTDLKLTLIFQTLSWDDAYVNTISGEIVNFIDTVADLIYLI